MGCWLLLIVSCLLATSGCKDEDTQDDPQPADDDDDATSSDDDATTSAYADEDGDGVADELDLCWETVSGVRTDPRGCSAAQASGCSVTLEVPADGATVDGDTITFDFDGDCEGYRLYASDSPAFQPHRRHLLADMIPAGEVDVSVDTLPTPDSGKTLYWAVEGSARGHSFLSEARSLKLE